MRAFISIEIPEKIKKEIKRIQSQIPEFNGKITGPENLHLTLKFLGDISEEMLDNVKRALSKINFPELELSLGEIGTFDYQRMPRIVWLRINHAESLQNKIDNALSGLFKPEERFMSHLTIARIKFVADIKKFKQIISNINYEKPIFRVKSFHLRESLLTKQGPAYNTLEEYKAKH